ncbi:MAG: GDSL-type esterase/lipase family protein [Bacteroidales bacterium]|jgi:lysophospholipase L1-like esterase|nr:GDSL-type esterase/lipase family protein [Bacteroidales bacterium]
MKKSLVLIILAIGTFSLAYSQQPATAVDSSQYSAYWWHSKDMYDHLPDTRNEIIFLGNSITDGAEWFEMFDNKRCHNRGISADVTDGILLRLDAITRLKPAKIFIMIGVNDLSRNMTVDQITANYRTILERIKAETPKTKVYVESVLPVNPATGMALNHTNKTGVIMELNGRLSELATEFGHTYIDLFSLMADSDNHLPGKYSIDGLHLTYEGYRVWVDAIRKYVR